MSSLKQVIVGLVFLWALPSLAVEVDGTWIKKGLDAHDRISARQSASCDDVTDAVALTYLIAGVLSVHRQNNLMAGIAVSTSTKQGQSKKLSEREDATVRTALAFVPLVSVPYDLSTEQIFAIVRKYLNDHPEEWGKDAPTLITEALKGAFEKHR